MYKNGQESAVVSWYHVFECKYSIGGDEKIVCRKDKKRCGQEEISTANKKDKKILVFDKVIENFKVFHYMPLLCYIIRHNTCIF